MLVSYLWLKELVEFDETPEGIAKVLTSLGLEAAIVDDRRDWYGDIVTGKVMSVEKHPDADRLNLTKVDVGVETLEIVCGAPNVAVGLSVPVALIGAVTPDGLKIKKRKVRGQTSLGMILSESELKLSDDHDGIMALDGDPAPGENFAGRYELCDTVLEIDLTPNRGDAASMIGVAREIAAYYGAKLKKPPTPIDESDTSTESLVNVEITAPDLCPRYSARAIRNITLAPSPFWMRRRLAAVGIRSINNIVDITNYILIETGHPLHAFDYDKVADGKIVVRRANDGERFTTLDGKEHKLSNDQMVIADGERAVALAGIMGGQNSEVSGGTKNILLESAFFTPSSIRKTGKELGVFSESSYRFERGTDIEGLIYAQDRATSLMASLGGGSVAKGRVDKYPSPVERRLVPMRVARMNGVIGLDIDKEKAVEILQRLEMAPETDNGVITVKAPTFRFDIEREIDLIEEIARHTGYDKIDSSIPRVAASDESVSPLFALRSKLRYGFLAGGMLEGLRYSFMNESDLDRLLIPTGERLRSMVPIDNPLSSEWTHLRTTLLPGMISPMKGVEDASIFEIGVVFRDDGESVTERWMAGGVLSESVAPSLYTGRSGKRDFFDLKGVIESSLVYAGYSGRFTFGPSNEPYLYPKRQAVIKVDSVDIGYMGQAHPSVSENYEVDGELFVFELDIDTLSRLAVSVVRHRGKSKFPSAKRDLAVVAPEEMSIERMVESIRKHGGKSLDDVALFDLFRSDKIGEDKKSAAFALKFRNEERTLTDDEADNTFAKIVDGLAKECNARLR